ncbi:hypothetical protein NCCP133_02980 [Cytobacillus sp. NCCP-133]|nr:hypothetical protein NCCP133_02980 [Cytobacillus sp. NCCP-133]
MMIGIIRDKSGPVAFFFYNEYFANLNIQKVQVSKFMKIYRYLS